MTDTINPMESLSASPSPEIQLTVSPADTSLDSPEPVDKKEDEKKPTKKRKSWGQELPVPKTNLPPRFVSLQVLRYRLKCQLTGFY